VTTLAIGDVDDATRVFLEMWFDMGNYNSREAFRTSLGNSTKGYRERIQAGLAEVIRKRLLTLAEFEELTFAGGVDVETEGEVYPQLNEAYVYLFDEPVPV
jgi:hypothetical protein